MDNELKALGKFVYDHHVTVVPAMHHSASMMKRDGKPEIADAIIDMARTISKICNRAMLSEDLE